MTPFPYTTKSLILFFKRMFVTFLRKNWLNILLGIAVVFLFSQKNIQLQLSWEASTFFESPKGVAINDKRLNSDKKPLEQAFSLGSLSFNSKSSNDEISKITESALPSASKVRPGDYWSIVFRDRSSGEYSFDQTLVEQYESYCHQYIKRFAPVAVAEMHKFGIPASIKLAQALLASNAGKSPLTQRFQNHFGIQCFAKQCQAGHCASHADLGHKSFYRQHESAWMSYRAHSELLGNDRYQSLKNFGTKDYEAWALGLEEAGYSTDSNYAQHLIAIIEYFALDRFDQ